MTGSQPSKAARADRLAATALDLARLFSAGATMWAVSPEWPWHARHVAVEFVHPVIVGKRALPAVALDGDGWADHLCSASRPGDIMVVLASVGHPDVASACRRAGVWGLRSVWIGVGSGPVTRPGPDHWIPAGDDQATVPYSGDLVRLYHVLWELTHVCFEHPGLLVPSPPDRDADGATGVCITCTDEGRPAEVLVVAGDEATVRSTAGVEHVDVSLVDDPSPGDVVLVHAGTAISLLESAR